VSLTVHIVLCHVGVATHSASFIAVNMHALRPLAGPYRQGCRPSQPPDCSLEDGPVRRAGDGEGVRAIRSRRSDWGPTGCNNNACNVHILGMPPLDDIQPEDEGRDEGAWGWVLPSRGHGRADGQGRSRHDGRSRTMASRTDRLPVGSPTCRIAQQGSSQTCPRGSDARPAMPPAMTGRSRPSWRPLEGRARMDAGHWDQASAKSPHRMGRRWRNNKQFWKLRD
jgi:hypothetical protein